MSDGNLRVTASVQNPSRMAIYGTARMAVADAAGKVIRASADFPPTLLLPGMTLEGSNNLGWKLEAGDYTLIGIVTYGALDEARDTTLFKIGESLARPSQDWGEVPSRLKGGVSLWVIALAALGALLLLLAAWLWLPFLEPCRRRLKVAARVMTGAYEKLQQPPP